MATGKLTGNDLRMAIVEKACTHQGTYDTSLVREVFDFCWEQLCWRASGAEMHALADELKAELDR